MGEQRTLKPVKIKANSRNKQLMKNQQVRSLYGSRLRELAMARFQWDNLPDEIDPRFLEMTLNEYGMMAFFWDEIAEQYACLPMMIEGDFNIYNNPKDMNVWAINGYNRSVDFTNSVPIFNNMLRDPTWPWLDYYADQLYEVDMARLVNIKAQKTPILLRGSEKQRLTLKNIWLEYDGNEPMIMADESLDGKPLEVLTTGAPFVGEELTQMRRHMLGEVMIYLGYQTQEATQKRERVLSGEVEAAQSESASSRFSPLLCRRQACEKINKMFGLNVSVNFRQDTSTLFELDNPLMQYRAKEVDNDLTGGIPNG